jgi:hypothetical protein
MPRISQKQLRKAAGHVPLVVLAVAAIIIIAFCLWLPYQADLNFRSSTVGNLIATLLGTVFAIPVGLAISANQQLREQIKMDREFNARRSVEKRKLCTSLLDELDCNISLAIERFPKDGGNPVIGSRPYSIELWDTFRISGGISLIDNPSLLANLSRAYYLCKATNGWEQLILSSPIDFTRQSVSIIHHNPERLAAYAKDASESLHLAKKNLKTFIDQIPE